jgi:hypothetical protein
MLSRESTRLLKARCSGPCPPRATSRPWCGLRDRAAFRAGGPGGGIWRPGAPGSAGSVGSTERGVGRAAHGGDGRLGQARFSTPQLPDPARLVVSDAFAVRHAAGGAKVRPKADETSGPARGAFHVLGADALLRPVEPVALPGLRRGPRRAGGRRPASGRRLALHTPTT